MAAAVSFQVYQNEFDKARESLKDVDESIKKLTGRDPKLQRKRRGIENVSTGPSTKDKRRDSSSIGGSRGRGSEEERTASGKRNGSSAFSRLGSREEERRHNRRRSDDEDEEYVNKPSVQSSVISNPNKLLIKTRRDSLIELKNDKKVMDRNRRMFGLLMGTLQKFQNEQTQQKDKEKKRQEIEDKLEEAAVKEKEEVQKERRYLFLARRKKQALLRQLERKMEITKEHEEWEKQQMYYLRFIKTNVVPNIMYLPAKSTAVSEKRLGDSAAVILTQIEKRRKQMQEEIQELDEQDQIEGANSEQDDDKDNNSFDFNSKNITVEGNDNNDEANGFSQNKKINDLTDLTNQVDGVDSSNVMNSVKEQLTHESDLNSTQQPSSNEQEFEPMYD